MKRLVIGIAALFLSGCVMRKPGNYTVSDNKVVSVPREQAWTRLVHFFASQKMRIDNIDKASGFLSASWEQKEIGCDEQIRCGPIKRDHLDCGEVLLHLPVGYRQQVNVVMVPAGTGTQVSLNTMYTLVYRLPDIGVRDERPCVSTGKLEAEILAAIQSVS